MQKLFSDYSKEERGLLTDQEFKEICLNEIEVNPSAPVDLYKSYVGMIDMGVFKNPYSPNPIHWVWKIPLLLLFLNTVAGNLFPSSHAYKIPVLSDVTPVFIEIRDFRGGTKWKVVSQSDFYNSRWLMDR